MPDHERFPVRTRPIRLSEQVRPAIPNVQIYTCQYTKLQAYYCCSTLKYLRQMRPFMNMASDGFGSVGGFRLGFLKQFAKLIFEKRVRRDWAEKSVFMVSFR